MWFKGRKNTLRKDWVSQRITSGLGADLALIVGTAITAVGPGRCLIQNEEDCEQVFFLETLNLLIFHVRC